MAGIPLRVLRVRAGLSQRALARQVQMSIRAIISTERGESLPHPRNREAIARAVGVAMTDILEFQDDYPPTPTRG